MLTNKTQRESGYAVDSVLAVEILKLHNPKAAKWWLEDTTVVKSRDFLVFSPDCCEVVYSLPSIILPGEATSGQINVAEFLERLPTEGCSYAPFWLSFVIDSFTPKVFLELQQSTLTRPAVFILAAIIVNAIQRQIQNCWDENRFKELHKEGHAFLKKFCEIAIQGGIKVTEEEIDKPLSYVDVGLREGIIEETEGGNVRLSKEAEEAFRRRENAENN